MIPWFSCDPIMVCVFPAPVAPYAKTVALYPFRMDGISSFAVFRYTASVSTSGPNAQSVLWNGGCGFFGCILPQIS